jgi:hypothetical protein
MKMFKVPDGTYRARAVAGSEQLGFSSKGTEQIALVFALTGEGYEDQQGTWFGYLSDAAAKYALASLRAAGWTGDDISETPLPGVGDVECEVVIENEEYEGKTRSKIQFVNRVGGVVLKTPMTDAQRKSFAARMKSAAVASRQENGVAAPKTATKPAPKSREPGEDDDQLGF